MRNLGVFIWEMVWLENCLNLRLRQFLYKYSNILAQHLYSRINTPTFSTRHTSYHLPMKMEQSVPKCRHIKFRSRGTTQKKAYNVLYLLCILNPCSSASTSLLTGQFTHCHQQTLHLPLKRCSSDCTHLCCDWCGRWGIR